MSVFDTHSSYEQLVEAGVPASQADVHVKILSTLVDEKLVTKEFLRAELQALRQEMRDLNASLRQEMLDQNTSLRQEMLDQNTSLRQEMLDQLASLRQEMRDQNASLRQELSDRIVVSERNTKNWVLLVAGVQVAMTSLIVAALALALVYGGV